MSFAFEISITTVEGRVSWKQRANSVQQIKDYLPEKVQIFEATVLPLTSDSAVIEDEELWLDLCSAVHNIDEVVAMTPESLEKSNADQLLALNGLAVRLN